LNHTELLPVIAVPLKLDRIVLWHPEVPPPPPPHDTGTEPDESERNSPAPTSHFVSATTT
jgi:hypothetical protein